MRKLWWMLLFGIVCLAGCRQEGEKRVADLDYTVVAGTEVPEELASVIEEKKSGDFRLTYSAGEFLYLVCGYGRQETGGYSIQVKELYLTENSIVLDTELIGPDGGTETGQSEASEPVIVIKTQLREEPVIFR